MSNNFPRPMFVYEVEGFGQFYLCPDCLEFIERDIYLECGQVYYVSTKNEEYISIQGEKVLAKISGGGF